MSLVKQSRQPRPHSNLYAPQQRRGTLAAAPGARWRASGPEGSDRPARTQQGERPSARFSPCRARCLTLLNTPCTIRTLISEGRALLTTACLLASRSFKTSRTSALLSRPPSLSTLSKRERVLSVKHHDSTSLWHARALLDSLGALTSSSIHSGPRSSSCGQEGEYSKKSSDLVVPNSRRILKLCQKYYAGF